MAYSVEHLKGIVGSHGGMAKSNLFSVVLPQIQGSNAKGGELNLLCKNVALPARQMLTLERNINGYRSKVGNGSATDDIAMTFHVTNSMVVREYFEAWMTTIWNKETRRSGYYEDYAKEIQIKVLRMPKFNTTFQIPGVEKLPESIRSGLPEVSLGPINASLASGTLSLDLGQDTTEIITLENAYPFTVNSVELGNENEGLMELTVSFTFSEWYSKPGLGNKLAGSPF